MMATLWPRELLLWHPAMPRGERRAYLARLGAAGLRIHFVTCSTRWHTPGDAKAGVPDGITAALGEIRDVLAAVPEAYIMLRLNVSPPVEWVNAHPEEQVTFNDGSHRRVSCTSVSRTEPLDGMHSLCSGKWMARADEALEEFFGALAEEPESARVIGTFLCAGGTSEWYYPEALVVDGGRRHGDFSEPFRAFYAGFLRRKYGTEEELRRVWKRPDATFDHPLIPTPEERTFIRDADAEIMKALRVWEMAARTLGGSSGKETRAKMNLGVFLNANDNIHVADFFDAWNESTARTIVHFAGTLKRLRPNLLVGAFYGAYGCQNYFDNSTASATRVILDSGVVDFLAAPGVYNNREPGGIVAQREMQDSLRLRNMIYVCEDDARTHLCEPWMQRDAMQLYGVRDSLETLKRDFGRNICEDVQGWWFDMGPGWYDDPAILALFARQREIADLAYSLDRTKRNDIALIYDTESLHYVSQLTSQTVLDYYRTSDLGRLGAPVDYYFHNDLARPGMPDYRLYVMLNQYCLTDDEREAVYAKARRNGATILWLYAAGFVNSRAARTMDVGNVSRTVGMNVGLIDRTFFPHFRVDPASHPALARAARDRRYGVIDRDIHSNVWIGKLEIPQYLNPGFFIDDPRATVLGRYCSDGRAALAVADVDGVKSVYCATTTIRSDLVASIAAWSGCHIYCDSDDVLYANENFLVIHASGDGRRQIRFKRACTPFELYEQRAYGSGVASIEADLLHGETKMWQLR